MIFKSKRLSVSHEQTLFFPPEKVFPLLCPVREYEWIEGWNCEIIWPESGYAEQDGIFTTKLPDGSKDTWFIDEYKKNSLIQFIRISDSRAIKYTITLLPEGTGTKAIWEQQITALNSDGNRLIEEFSAEEFASHIELLENMLNNYLKTGEMLRMDS